MNGAAGSAAISVVVPTHNRSARLAALIAALEAQTLPAERFEVIVVDDGSGDETPALLERSARSLNIRSLRCETPRGPAVARNLGWQAASAELVAFTDDDCEPAPRWLESLCAAAEAEPGAVVQGRTEPIPGERDRVGLFSRTLQVQGLGPWYQTCNVAYPRTLLERLGGFDERYPSPGGEDTDLAWRAIEAGGRVLFSPDALVHHAVNELGPLGKLRVALRWTDAAWIFRRHRGLREQLHWGLFWKPSHAKLLLALVGLAAVRRFPPALLLGLPYYREAVGRCNELGLSRSALPYIALHDAVETVGAARGAVRYRVLIL